MACIAIGLIVVLGVAHSWIASRTKSPTFDEPVHLLSSWLIVNHGDFRVNPEHPPLWKYVAGLPLIGSSLEIDLHSDRARSLFAQIENQGAWATDLLFHHGNDGRSLVTRARLAMSVFFALTLITAARWAWAAGGWTAALITSTLLAFDPNFLAHGSLVTNDVAASFIFVLAGYLTWQLGRCWCWKTAAALAVTCAAGAGIKFTCVLLVAIVGAPLVIRSIAAHPWPAVTGTFIPRGQRMLYVSLLAATTLALALVALWSMYGFRAAPTSSGAAFDASYPRNYLAYNAIAKEMADANTPISDEQIKAAVGDYRPSPPTRFVYWLQDHGLIPQALGYGLTYAAGRGILRPSFLLGDYSERGFWLYFPVAIATKTPLTTLAVLLMAAILGIVRRKQWAGEPSKRWLLLCLLSCPGIYLTVAIGSNLNIGVRHILPIYPAMYVAAGIALAGLICLFRPARYVVPATLVLLVVETSSAYPNYLAFFNRAAGGERGGLAILGDSNLDWGQDLPALADWYQHWRAAHPDDAFYLAYFGSADPRAYGIDYINMTPGFVYDERPSTLDLRQDGIVAISATWLQGTFPAELRPMMEHLRARQPIDVINGSIYLYEFHRPQASSPQ